LIARADLHVHTRFSRWKHLAACNARDSYSDPLDVFHRLRGAGMDYVVFTDHDSIEGALDLLSRHPELEPRVIVGEEVETWLPGTRQWLHLNVFGIDQAVHRDIRHLAPDVRELTGYLRARGILHALNHPLQSFRWQKAPRLFMDEMLSLFDHFESRNATLSSRHNAFVERLLAHARRLGLRKHGLGGSDAHILRHLAACHTELPDASRAESADKGAFLRALAAGRGRAVGESIGAAALTAAVYRIVGRYYLEFGRASGRREMRARHYVAAAALAPGVVAGVPGFLNLSNSLRLEAVTWHCGKVLQQLERRGHGALALPGLLEDPPG
jgi:hypothetical protein